MSLGRILSYVRPLPGRSFLLSEAVVSVFSCYCSEGCGKKGGESIMCPDEGATYFERTPGQGAVFRLVSGPKTHGQQLAGTCRNVLTRNTIFTVMRVKGKQ